MLIRLFFDTAGAICKSMQMYTSLGLATLSALDVTKHLLNVNPLAATILPL